MSEKTEKPTPKRQRDARKKGQVAKSQEISSGVQLLALFGYFSFEGPQLLRSLQYLIDVTIGAVNRSIDTAIGEILGAFLQIAVRFMGSIAAMLIIMTVLAIMMQTGPIVAPEGMKPSLKKLNPLGNLKQMFSMKSLFEFCKNVCKVMLLSLVFFYLLRQYMPSLQFLPRCGADCGLGVVAMLLQAMWLTLIAFYAVIGVADFAFQKHNVNKQLMMSREDIKKEHKESEGDPEIKKKRKEIYREVQSGSLAANVRKSTVVVRNPTHVAVCLYYRQGETPLPQVIEMGYDAMARHIVRLAEKAGVPVVEHIPLARALASRVNVGGYIPPDLFEPVAHILRAAMNLAYDGADDEEADERDNNSNEIDK